MSFIEGIDFLVPEPVSAGPNAEDRPELDERWRGGEGRPHVGLEHARAGTLRVDLHELCLAVAAVRRDQERALACVRPHNSRLSAST